MQHIGCYYLSPIIITSYLLRMITNLRKPWRDILVQGFHKFDIFYTKLNNF